jgi:RNA polymerase sigma factor (sigma-70 family)
VDAIAPVPRSRLAVPRRLVRLRSDAALAQRFAAGDETAFGVLYERHRSTVLAVCLAVVGSRDDAEDASQEAFAALAVALRENPPRELRAWLVRVARNAAIDVARRRRDRPMPDDALEMPAAAAGADRIELDSVLAGIRELPETQRTALLMRELAGHSYQEIATLLGTDPSSVRGLIARARIGLRNYRAAAEMECAIARTALCEEPDGRRQNRTVRRHVRGCAPCRAYQQALRSDARALRALAAPAPAGGMAGGGAVVSLVAKGALLGGAATQVGAACAVSVCTVGGLVLLAPHTAAIGHQRAPTARQVRVGHRGGGQTAAATRAASPVTDAGAGTSTGVGLRRPIVSDRTTRVTSAVRMGGAPSTNGTGAGGTGAGGTGAGGTGTGSSRAAAGRALRHSLSAASRAGSTAGAAGSTGTGTGQTGSTWRASGAGADHAGDPGAGSGDRWTGGSTGGGSSGSSGSGGSSRSGGSGGSGGSGQANPGAGRWNSPDARWSGGSDSAPTGSGTPSEPDSGASASGAQGDAAPNTGDGTAGPGDSGWSGTGSGERSEGDGQTTASGAGTTPTTPTTTTTPSTTTTTPSTTTTTSGTSPAPTTSTAPATTTTTAAAAPTN